MFEYVSGANFFGEIVEWTGFAIATWSFAVSYDVDGTVTLIITYRHSHSPSSPFPTLVRAACLTTSL